jgi:hypothetical protein
MPAPPEPVKSKEKDIPLFEKTKPAQKQNEAPKPAPSETKPAQPGTGADAAGKSLSSSNPISIDAAKFPYTL